MEEIKKSNKIKIVFLSRAFTNIILLLILIFLVCQLVLLSLSLNWRGLLEGKPWNLERVVRNTTHIGCECEDYSSEFSDIKRDVNDISDNVYEVWSAVEDHCQ